MQDTIQVVCAHCAAVNRVQRARLSERPRCGRCRQTLFSGQPIELNAESFARQVQANSLPIVIDFWAPWCGPCRAMAPHFERAARELEPAARLAKVDTEQCPELAQRFGIQSIPTVAIFAGGREIARQSGAMDAGTLTRWVRSHIS